METPTINQVMNPEMVKACEIYILAKAYAETVREEVGAVQRQVLAEINSPCAEKWKRQGDNSPILDPKRAYLLPDLILAKYHAEYQYRIRRGGKWDEIPEDHCPALVAEELARQAQRVIIDLTAPLFGIDADRLLCAGLDKYEQWADLQISLAIKSPLWTDPIKAKRA